MAKPYSEDLRQRALEAIEAGHPQSDVAKMLKISRRTIVDYVRRWRTTGGVGPGKFGGHKEHKLAEHADKVKALIVCSVRLIIIRANHQRAHNARF